MVTRKQIDVIAAKAVVQRDAQQKLLAELRAKAEERYWFVSEADFQQWPPLSDAQRQQSAETYNAQIPALREAYVLGAQDILVAKGLWP